MKNKQHLLKSLLPGLLMGFLTLGGQVNLIAEDSQQVPSVMAEENSTFQVDPDKSMFFYDAEGSTVQISSDGTKTIKKTDGTIIQIKRDGSKFIQNVDGSSVQINSDGSKIIKKPDGSSIEIKPAPKK